MFLTGWYSGKNEELIIRISLQDNHGGERQVGLRVIGFFIIRRLSEN